MIEKPEGVYLVSQVNRYNSHPALARIYSLSL